MERRDIILRVLFFALFESISSTQTERQLCEKLDEGLFSTCVHAGINTTIIYPSNPGNSAIVSSLTSQTINELKKCSPYVDFLICSVSVPKCEEGVEKPVLPCRRVCEDVVRGCTAHEVYNGDVEWLKGLCRILPDSGRHCIEPTNFKPMNRKVPIETNCTKLYMPQCQDFGYNYTTKSFVEQLYLSAYFDTIFNESVTESSSSYCKSVVQSFLCIELAPPCFKGKHSIPAIYTVCKTRCLVLWEECPAVLRQQFGIFEECSMEDEEETAYQGFCRASEWPGTHKWMKAMSNMAKIMNSTRHFTTDNPEPTVHAAAITITLCMVAACATITTGIYCYIKKRRLVNMRGYWRHGDVDEEERTVIVVS